MAHKFNSNFLLSPPNQVRLRRVSPGLFPGLDFVAVLLGRPVGHHLLFPARLYARLLLRHSPGGPHQMQTHQFRYDINRLIPFADDNI
jgi:hypothetical protein